MADIQQSSFWNALFWKNFFVSLKGPNWEWVSIGSGNGFYGAIDKPNRWKIITWTNDDPVHWCMYASLGLNELM